MTSEELIARVSALSFPTLAELGAESAPELEEALASFQVIELWLWPSALRYCTLDLLAYVYVAAGDRHPRKDFRQQASRNQLNWLAAEAFAELLAAPAAMTAVQLRDGIGAERTSALVVERALHELARTLKVVRCGRTPLGDPLWRPLCLALPEIPRAIDHISQLQAAAALITHHLETAVCATEDDFAAFFSPLFPRTRIHEALAGLEAARKLTLTSLDGRPAWRMK